MDKTKCAVEFDHRTSDAFEVETRPRQNNALPPILLRKFTKNGFEKSSE